VTRFPFFLGHPLAGAPDEQPDQEGEKRSEYDADWKADPECRHDCPFFLALDAGLSAKPERRKLR
jgi:hypothetical protein